MARVEKVSRVFLCHNSREKELVKALALELLKASAVRSWLDGWQIPGGANWEAHIRRAFAASWSCIVLLGGEGLGPYQQLEIAWALERQRIDPDYAVVPVLLPGSASNLLEGIFKNIHYIDLTRGWEQPDALEMLFRALHGNAPRPPVVAVGVAVSAEQWNASSQSDASLLYRGRALDEARSLLERPQIYDHLSLAFIAASVAAAEARTRRMALFLGVLLAAATVAMYVVNHLRGIAEERRLLAASQAIAAEARREAPQELVAGLAHAVEAYRMSPSVEAETALMDLLSRARRLRQILTCAAGHKATAVALHEGAPSLVAFVCRQNKSELRVVSTDGRVLYSGTFDEDIRTLAFATPSDVAFASGNTIKVVNVIYANVTPLQMGADGVDHLTAATQASLLFSSRSNGEVLVWHRDKDWSSTVLRTAGAYSLAGLMWRSDNTLQLDVGGGRSELVSLDGAVSPGTLLPTIDALRNAHADNPGCPNAGSRSDKLAIYPAPLRVAYTTDTNELVVASPGVTGGTDCTVLTGHTHNMLALTFGESGRIVASAGAIRDADDQHGVLVWDLEQIHPLATRILPSTAVPTSPQPLLAISRDGSSWACSGCMGQTLWDTFAVEINTAEPSSRPRAIALSPAGDDLLLGFDDRVVESLHRGARHCISRHQTPLPSEANRLWYDDTTPYVLSADGALRALSSAGPVRTVVAPSSCVDVSLVDQTVVSDDGRRISRSDLQERVTKSWALPPQSGNCASLRTAGASDVAVRLSASFEPILIWSSREQGKLDAWANPMRDVSGLRTILSHPNLSDDGERLFAVSNTNAAALFNLSARRLIGSFELAGLREIALSGNGELLLTASEVGLAEWTVGSAAILRRAEDMLSGKGPTEMDRDSLGGQRADIKPAPQCATPLHRSRRRRHLKWR